MSQIDALIDRLQKGGGAGLDPDKLSPSDELTRTRWPDVKIEKDVVYSSVGGRELRCDVYTKQSAQGFPALPSGKRVGVCVIYGGGWIAGNKNVPFLFGCHLASAGYVAVVPEYRLAPKDRWPACLHDVKACVRWMRANADRLGISADHIACQGNSAGGQLALMLRGPTQRTTPTWREAPGATSIPARCRRAWPSTPPRTPASTRGTTKRP